MQSLCQRGHGITDAREAVGGLFFVRIGARPCGAHLFGAHRIAELRSAYSCQVARTLLNTAYRLHCVAHLPAGYFLKHLEFAPRGHAGMRWVQVCFGGAGPNCVSNSTAETALPAMRSRLITWPLLSNPTLVGMTATTTLASRRC